MTARGMTIRLRPKPAVSMILRWLFVPYRRAKKVSEVILFSNGGCPGNLRLVCSCWSNDMTKIVVFGHQVAILLLVACSNLGHLLPRGPYVNPDEVTNLSLHFNPNLCEYSIKDVIEHMGRCLCVCAHVCYRHLLRRI